MRSSFILLCLLSRLCTAQTVSTFKKYVNDNNDIVSVNNPDDWIATEAEATCDG